MITALVSRPDLIHLAPIIAAAVAAVSVMASLLGPSRKRAADGVILQALAVRPGMCISTPTIIHGPSPVLTSRLSTAKKFLGRVQGGSEGAPPLDSQKSSPEDGKRRRIAMARLRKYGRDRDENSPYVRGQVESARHRAYKIWLGRSPPEEYLINEVHWNGSLHALEPNLFPYELPAGMEHWVLWLHPDMAGPNDEVSADQVWRMLDCYLATGRQTGKVWRGRVGLRLGGIASCFVFYENLPALRSVMAIRHFHVFVDVVQLGQVHPEAVTTMSALRQAWEERSTWLRIEREQGLREGDQKKSA